MSVPPRGLTYQDYLAIFGIGNGTFVASWHLPSSDAYGFLMKSVSSIQPTAPDTVLHLIATLVFGLALSTSLPLAQPSPWGATWQLCAITLYFKYVVCVLWAGRTKRLGVVFSIGLGLGACGLQRVEGYVVGLAATRERGCDRCCSHEQG